MSTPGLQLAPAGNITPEAMACALATLVTSTVNPPLVAVFSPEAATASSLLLLTFQDDHVAGLRNADAASCTSFNLERKEASAEIFDWVVAAEACSAVRGAR